jgi:hypothetical protein
MSVTGLTATTQITRQAVAKHLQVLERAGLALGTRSGRHRVWKIDSIRFDEARRWLDRVEGQWDEALARLRDSVER